MTNTSWPPPKTGTPASGGALEKLSGKQFAYHPQMAQRWTQSGLFPHTGTGPTRPLEHAEMTPHQFNTAPGAWYHATYHSQLPTPENKLGDPDSFGTHFGTYDSAHHRLQASGFRNEDIRQDDLEQRGVVDHQIGSAYGTIHVRRIKDESTFVNAPHSPFADEGAAWSDHGGNSYYKNDVEDAGSTSIKVQNMRGMTSHVGAIAEAMKPGGGRVSPQNKYLIGRLQAFKQHGLDQPMPDPRAPKSPVNTDINGQIRGQQEIEYPRKKPTRQFSAHEELI